MNKIDRLKIKSIYMLGFSVLTLAFVTAFIKNGNFNFRSEASDSAEKCSGICQQVCQSQGKISKEQCVEKCNSLCPQYIKRHFSGKRIDNNRSPIVLPQEPLQKPSLAPKPTPTTSTNKGLPGEFTTHTSQTDGRQYIVYTPKGTAPSGGWPLVLFIHGSGVLNKPGVDSIFLEAFPQMLTQKKDFPFMMVAPKQSSADVKKNWLTDSAVVSIMNVLAETQARYPTNIKKTYLTGYSLGAGTTWNIGLRYPKRFAALIPVAGYFQNPPIVPSNICDLKSTPVWAFHGALDPTVPVIYHQQLVNALIACGGGKVHPMTVYSDGTHDISGRAYVRNDALYQWMLGQSLP